MIKQRIANILLIILFILQFFDGYFTYIGVSHYGIELEGNPLMRQMIDVFGVPFGLILAKSVGIIFIYLMYETCKQYISTIMMIMFFALTSFYMLVVITWLQFLLERGLI